MIEIYSKPSCPYCIKAKQLLESKNLEYNEFIVGKNSTKEDIQFIVDGMGLDVEIKTVPQIFLIENDGKRKYVGGFTELKTFKF